MSQQCNHDCSNYKANCSDRKNSGDRQSMLEKLNDMSIVRNVIAILSGKRVEILNLNACRKHPAGGAERRNT